MAKKNLYSKISYLNYPPTSCKELDLIVRRFLLKKYKLRLNYDSTLKLKKNIGNKYFRLTIKHFLRDIIFDLRPRGSNYLNKQNYFNKNDYHPNVLILSHDLSNSFEAYKNLPKKLRLFLKKKILKQKSSFHPI